MIKRGNTPADRKDQAIKLIILCLLIATLIHTLNGGGTIFLFKEGIDEFITL